MENLVEDEIALLEEIFRRVVGGNITSLEYDSGQPNPILRAPERARLRCGISDTVHAETEMPLPSNGGEDDGPHSAENGSVQPESPFMKNTGLKSHAVDVEDGISDDEDVNSDCSTDSELDVESYKPRSLLPACLGSSRLLKIKTRGIATKRVYVDCLETKVSDLLAKIGSQECAPAECFSIFVDNQQLDEKKSLRELNIRAGDAVDVHRSENGPSGFLAQWLHICYDARFNKNYAKDSDDGSKHVKGRSLYDKPYGWTRYAFKVIGQYEDDTWLGYPDADGKMSKQEWPVAYLGTSRSLLEGYSQKRRKDKKFPVDDRGKIVTTPIIAVASELAETTEIGQKSFKFVLQARIHPERCDKEVLEDGNEFWLYSRGDDVRAYGVLIKELTKGDGNVSGVE